MGLGSDDSERLFWTCSVSSSFAVSRSAVSDFFLVAVSCLGRWRGPPFLVTPRKAEVLFHFLLPIFFRKQKLNGAAGIPFYCTYFAHHHILICFFMHLNKVDGWTFLVWLYAHASLRLLSSFCSSRLITIGYHISPPNPETLYCRKTTLIHEMSIRYPTQYSNDTPQSSVFHVHEYCHL
jgi:hypothetical protein